MPKVEKFPNIPNSQITYFGYRAEPYLTSSYIGAGLSDKKNIKKYFGIKNTTKLLQANYEFFNYQPSVEKFSEELHNKIQKSDSKYISSVVSACLKTGNNLLKLSEQIGKKAQPTNLSSEELMALFKSYSDCVYDYCAFYIIAWFEAPEKKVAEKLAEKYSSKNSPFNEIFSAICTPSQETAAEFEQDAFLKLCSKRNLLKTPVFFKLCEAHAKKFGWLSVRFCIGTPWTAQDVFKRATLVKPDDALKHYKEKQKHRKQIQTELKKCLNLMSPKDRNLVKQVRDIIFLRTQRSDFFHHSTYFVIPLLNKMSTALNTSYEDLLYYSSDELLSALKGDAEVLKNLSQRKKCFVAFFDGKSQIIQGAQAVKYIESRPVLKLAFKQTDTLQGITANPGKVSGTAKIIISNKDLNKVNRGDILITTMTTPNFISAMEKAAAFVTNEGGILCHAAIISREMHKPCIISTKIATKVFKDGDVVEVDANKGIVKKLK